MIHRPHPLIHLLDHCMSRREEACDNFVLAQGYLARPRRTCSWPTAARAMLVLAPAAESPLDSRTGWPGSARPEEDTTTRMSRKA